MKKVHIIYLFHFYFSNNERKTNKNIFRCDYFFIFV